MSIDRAAMVVEGHEALDTPAVAHPSAADQAR